MMFNIDPYLPAIKEICVKYSVKRLVLFGSALTSRFEESSDLDFIIELSDATKGLIRYMGVKSDLEALLSRPVDLVMPNAIKNDRIKKQIFSNTQELYDA
jgi:hypothetical protein